MQVANYQPTQPATSPLTNNQPVEVRKSFFFTHRQLILIGLIGGLVLLFIFGLGFLAGEKRALRKQLMPTNQPVLPTQNFTSPSPTITALPTPGETLPTQPPSPAAVSPFQKRESKGESSNPTRCTKDTDCIKCLFLYVPCEAGECVNGICVWPTSPPRPKK